MSCTKDYLHLHCDDSTTFQSLLSPDFFDPYFKGKSGDKGEVYASEVAFLQKAFSSAFSGFFCPLRYRVND